MAKLDQDIKKRQSIRDQLQHSSDCCQGNNTPGCPIIKDLAAENRHSGVANEDEPFRCRLRSRTRLWLGHDFAAWHGIISNSLKPVQDSTTSLSFATCSVKPFLSSLQVNNGLERLVQPVDDGALLAK
jgi:hypothetical protein